MRDGRRIVDGSRWTALIIYAMTKACWMSSTKPWLSI